MACRSIAAGISERHSIGVRIGKDTDNAAAAAIAAFQEGYGIPEDMPTRPLGKAEFCA
jgi:hypothetical protein